MSSIQYLVQPCAKVLHELNWSIFFAKAIGSVASPKVIDHLCRSEATCKITKSINFISTITVTSATTITSVVTRTSSTLPQPSSIISQHAIFTTLPGLSMHPLTLFLILTALLVFLAFGLFTFFLCRIRNNSIVDLLTDAEVELRHLKEDNTFLLLSHANEIKKIQSLAKFEEIKALKIATAESETRKVQEKYTSLVDKHTKSIQGLNSQLQESRNNVAIVEAEKKRLIAEHSHLVKSLQRQIADFDTNGERLTTEKQVSITERSVSHNRLNQKLAEAIEEVDRLKLVNESLVKQVSDADLKEKSRSQDLKSFKIRIADLEAEKESSTAEKDRSIQSLQQKVDDAAKAATRLAIEKDALMTDYTTSQNHVNEQLDAVRAEVDELKRRNKKLEVEARDADSGKKTVLQEVKQLQSRIARLEAEKEDLVTQNVTSQKALNQKDTDAAAEVAKVQASKNDLVVQHALSDEHLKNELKVTREEIGQLNKRVTDLTEDSSNADFDKYIALGERDHLRDQLTRLEAEKENLTFQHKELQKSLNQKIADADAAATRIQDSKDDLVAQHNSALQKVEKELCDALETIALLPSEITSYEELNKKYANVQNEATRLRDENNRIRKQPPSWKQEKAKLTHNHNETIKQKDQLQLSLDNITAERDTLAQAIVDKDSAIASLQASNRVLSNDASGLANARRDIRYRERRVEGQIATLRATNASLQQQIKQKDLDLNDSQTALAEQISHLEVADINYDELHRECKDANSTIDDLRSQILNAEIAALKQIAKDLGVSYPNIELMICQRARKMTSKAISARLSSAKKMLEDAAKRFNTVNKSRKERRHSVSGGETRVQVGETMPERSTKLMTPLEDDYLSAKAAAKAILSGPSDMPSFTEVKRSLRMGGRPYTSKDVKFLTRDAATSALSLLLPETSAINTEDFDLPLLPRGAKAALWAYKTKFDVAALFHHKVKELGKKAVASQGAAVEGLTQKYDNRLTSLYNQLNKYRLNGNIQSGVLDSALDGNQGLRSIISKTAKDN